MRTGRILSIVALASFTAVLEAQSQGTLNGPVAGYVFDKVSHGLRPILGLPGASLFGEPLSFGYSVSDAFVSPSLDSALAISSDGSSHFLRIQSGAVQEVSLSLGAAGSSFRAAFSPSGKALAFYSGSKVQLVTGLPGAPLVAGNVDLTSFGAPDALALSDDAKALLVSGNNSIHLFGSYTDLGKIMDTSAAPVMAFAAGTHDAAVSDTNAGVVLFHDLTGSGASQVVAAPDQSGNPYSAIAFSADERNIYVASSATQAITRLDLADGLSERLSCNCSPTSLTRMGNVFRITELASDPLWLLDSPEGDARIVFVPALPRPANRRPRPVAERPVAEEIR
ncbi:MAG: hypothetical protein JO336_06050 [Acidobacteriia bacterium]|nr:hypothetical protein [Terriglobia bacterium]MBV9746486.1 hypothetical protein [Terriglobia bacterium]